MNQHDQMLTEKEKLRLRSIKERESKWYFKAMTEPSLEHLITVGFMEGLKFRDEQTLAAEPAPLVRLTDEEILQIWKAVKANQDNLVVFYANAIMDAMIAKNGGKV